MDDLISEFITETTESISMLDSEMVKLEQNPEDAAILGNIFRIMHTIKGTCGFLGLPRLESVAHASENVLGKIRDKQLDASAEAVTLVLESLDSIKELIEHLSGHGSEPEGDDSDLIGRLNYFADTGTIGGGAEHAAHGAHAHAAPAEIVPSAAAATPAQGAVYSHFKDDGMDPEMSAAIAKLEAEMAAKAAAEAAVAAPAEKPAAPALVKSEPAKAAPKPAAKKEEAKAEGGEGGAGANQSIRVSIDVLENLMQMVSELVLTRNQLMQIVRTKEDNDFLTPLQHLSHITSELQEGVMKTRMQPIGNAWSKFPRLIRDLSLELGKKIDLKMEGAETELDRQLLEVIKDPLTHMVRNSCDHGLETPADRLAAGKGEMGTVTLSAYHEGGHIIIDIIDDGRGINIERVKKKALESGIVTEAQLETMSEKQIAQFIFAAGFSTAEKVTAVSGRGVGMDVVKTNIQKIGGTLDLDSTFGKGSKVSIKIPLTLAIVSVLIVEAGGQKFALPQINVSELVRVSPNSELAMEVINNALVLRLRGKLLPLAVLSEILGQKVDRAELMGKEMYIAVCRVGSYDFGVLVDRVYDTEEIVVKPVSEILKSISVYSGNTILGDGNVIMILDPNGIARSLGTMDSVRRDTADSVREIAGVRDGEVGFLSFTAGGGAPKAVPLELVSRLEEIDVTTIEIADANPVVQYRGDLMRLVTLNKDQKIPDKGCIDVIVFSYDKRVVGLVVDEILDIVHAPFDIKLASKESKSHGLLGSMVITGKATDVVDVGSILSEIVDAAVSDQSKISKEQAKNCELLLVEDSPFFRNLTMPFLSAVGYHVTSAESAEQALSMLIDQGKHFDMIVTDIEMPGMNGFEFATACRNAKQLNGIPIVAYTASMSDEVMKRSKKSGMNDCIVKTDRPGLLQSVARHLSEHREVAA
ncbi:MAG: chemotaxis protein CheW [Alphaproteobacteria bacterium]|nr:chemotaxis protein CheW [Alphaproteobacteria bacterium]